MPSSPETPGRWIHFVESVYGAWLYGDARGFRTRHHREHVDGDYNNPPPTAKYDVQVHQSIQSLKQHPVVLPKTWRPTIGGAIRERLNELGAFVLCLAQGGQHLHLLAKLPLDANPRSWMGIAKKPSAFEAKVNGWRGKLWARRGKEIRIRDRTHQLNAYHYIVEHAEQGAWVWVWERPADDGCTDTKPTDGGPWA